MLQLAACEDVTSALRSGEGTEIPKNNAPWQRAKLLVVSERAPASQSSEDASTGLLDAAMSGMGAQPNDEPDAEIVEPVSPSCPVQISLNTVSYGSGDEGQDDYAPNNVGAIWITKSGGDFVRTVVAWGPMYFDQALTWIDQTRGNLVDTVTLPTRPAHTRAVEASWDCRDTMQQLVAAGTYHVNLEFTEVEAQGPVLTGSKAVEVSIGDKPSESVRAPQGSFGEIHIKAGN